MFHQFFQHHIETTTRDFKLSFMNINFKNTLRYLALFFAAFLTSEAQAQVSISLGVQTIYDDNIFLEDKNRPQVPVLFNDSLVGPDGAEPRPLVLQNFDGKPNDDFITNVTAGVAGSLPFLRQSVKSSYDLTAGAVLFGTHSEQDRLILDGFLDTSLSDLILPGPYYLGMRNGIYSASNNVAAASSTATQTTQNYILTGETGIRGAEISRNLLFNLGYTGTYQKFLGEFSINDVKNQPSLVNNGGVDFHSHMGNTGLDYRVNKDLEVGVRGTGGVQIFTRHDPGDNASFNEIDPKDMDRINGELQGTLKYSITRTLFFDGAAGMGYSKMKVTPDPFEITIPQADGTTTSQIVNPKADNTGMTYMLSLNYAYRPGSLMTLGSSQGFTTNLDGKRFITRSTYANISEPIFDDLKLIIGGSYMQFEDESKVTPDFNRFEGSASLNYHIGRATSLVAGYNYTVQSTDSSGNSEFTTPTQEFKSNRFYIGINTGFVGLPL